MTSHRHIRDHDPMRWAGHANCFGVDPDLFYPERWDRATADQAKAICAGCTVREQCLEYALTHGEYHGIWGGIGEGTRKQLRVRRYHKGAA